MNKITHFLGMLCLLPAIAMAQITIVETDITQVGDVIPRNVDTLAAVQLLTQAKATTLIHGHTHKPATHDLGSGLDRVVLSDWDAAATPPRAQVLRCDTNGMQRINLL